MSPEERTIRLEERRAGLLLGAAFVTLVWALARVEPLPPAEATP